MDHDSIHNASAPKDQEDSEKKRQDCLCGSTAWDVMRELSGGVIPLSDGSFALTPDAWAEVLKNKTPTTVQRWVRDYKIPYRAYGDDRFIHQDDFWNHMPKYNCHGPPKETPPRK